MTTPSTISVLRARLNGQELPKPEPARKEKPAKAQVVMSEAQLAERERIRVQLLTGTSVVEFTKVDGTKSIMECTLDPALLPPSDLTAASARPEQNHLLHVYSTDRQGWRSFLVNNVTKIYKNSGDL